MKKEITNNSISLIFIFNVVLFLIAGLLVIYYIVQANIISASNYKISMLNQKLELLNEIHGSLAAQKSSMEDLARVLEFALSQNMVETENTTYLFESGNVALQR